MTTLPLDGVNVLDLTRVLAGPLATMMLGDLGARVLKVERPGRGDVTREWGPPFDDRGESAYYLSVNRNKISVAADLRRAADRKLILELAREADVVVENFSPGALARLGIDADAQLVANPRLIWCSITGFGPDSDRPGYDFVVQAEAGWMAITGVSEQDPMKVGVALADVVAGKDAAIAVLAALTGRERRRNVQRRIVISLAASARAALMNVAQNALVSGSDARRWGNAHPNLVPYQLFQARDRAIVIAVGTDEQWHACARTLGLEELERDAVLATNAGRVAHRDRIVRAFAAALTRRSADEWMAMLRGSRVPCGVVKSVREAVADASGASALTGMPSSIAGVVRLPPPRLDEHGDLVRQQGWGAFDHIS